MQKGICIGSLAGQTNAEKLALARDAGFDVVEFVVRSDGPAPALTSSAAELAALRETTDSFGIGLSSLLGGQFWQTSLTADDADERARAVDLAAGCLRVAAGLGVGCVLIVPAVVYLPHAGGEARQVAYDAAYERALASFRQIAAVAEQTGVDVGVENVWNGFLLSPLEYARFLDEVGSPRVGAYFDVGNVVPLGDPADWIDILGPRIKRIHVKDFSRSIGTIHGFVPLLAGDVPWPRVIAALERAGYDGPLTAEMGCYKHHPAATAYHTSTALDFILGRR